jgi:anaerobic selenocysteine-containing dehydrogenase
LGSHKTNGGKSVIRIRTAIKGMRNGAVVRVTTSKGRFATRATTNKTIPTGGVKVPIIRLRTITTPM